MLGSLAHLAVAFAFLAVGVKTVNVGRKSAVRLQQNKLIGRSLGYYHLKRVPFHMIIDN